ncbi:MAG: hypothetical protein RMK33_00080, partial [Arcobacter sp.]|nr:hypothetical protein [Arcobacter sp.]
RESELCWLTWSDVCLEPGREHVVVRAKPGFTPKDYEQREVPLPPVLAGIVPCPAPPPRLAFASFRGTAALSRLYGQDENARRACGGLQGSTELCVAGAYGAQTALCQPFQDHGGLKQTLHVTFNPRSESGPLEDHLHRQQKLGLSPFEDLGQPPIP